MVDESFDLIRELRDLWWFTRTYDYDYAFAFAFMLYALYLFAVSLIFEMK